MFGRYVCINQSENGLGGRNPIILQVYLLTGFYTAIFLKQKTFDLLANHSILINTISNQQQAQNNERFKTIKQITS
jgi:hypothetical protein